MAKLLDHDRHSISLKGIAGEHRTRPLGRTKKEGLHVAGLSMNSPSAAFRFDYRSV